MTTEIKINPEEGDFSRIRSEILKALNAFHAHVKYTITLMTTLVAAAVGLLTFSIQNQPDYVKVYSLISSVIFFMLLILSIVSLKICRRYYMIYASNYIYYARIHLRYNNVPHPWVIDLFRKQRLTREDIESDEAMDTFIEGKKSKDRNSWFYYRRILATFGLIGLIGFLTGIIAVYFP